MNPIYGTHDDNTLKQFEMCLNTGSAAAGVLCADGHYGYAHPIGGVVGYTDHISISGVGFDIACGNMAVRTDVAFDDIKDDTSKILNEISKVVSFGVGRANGVRVDHEVLDSDLFKDAGVEDLRGLAAAQLGTVGSGNHYVDLFREDATGLVWVGVHFGSRGLGHKITTKYLKEIGAKDQMDAPPALIEVGTPLADGYLAGVELGGLYAYAGREWVVDQVCKIIGASVTKQVHNHHNYMWKEHHFGQDMYVVRKGATPAFPGQEGFVGGSMGDDAVILEGVDSDESEAAMFSTVHGAGRTMSRVKARGKVHRKTGKVISKPAIDRREVQSWLEDKGVTVLGSDLDEAPQAYRRLNEVLDFHKNTIKINHTLSPFGVIMAGSDVVDPYKD